jgi:hypothetical protein
MKILELTLRETFVLPFFLGTVSFLRRHSFAFRTASPNRIFGYLPFGHLRKIFMAEFVGFPIQRPKLVTLVLEKYPFILRLEVNL